MPFCTGVGFKNYLLVAEYSGSSRSFYRIQQGKHGSFGAGIADLFVKAGNTQSEDDAENADAGEQFDEGQSMRFHTVFLCGELKSILMLFCVPCVAVHSAGYAICRAIRVSIRSSC